MSRKKPQQLQTTRDPTAKFLSMHSLNVSLRFFLVIAIARASCGFHPRGEKCFLLSVCSSCVVVIRLQSLPVYTLPILKNIYKQRTYKMKTPKQKHQQLPPS